MKKKNSNFKVIIFYIVLFVAIILALTFMFSSEKEEQPKYGDIVEYFQKDVVKEFKITSDNVITLVVYEDYEITAKNPTTQTPESTENETTESETISETDVSDESTETSSVLTEKDVAVVVSVYFNEFLIGEGNQFLDFS